MGLSSKNLNRIEDIATELAEGLGLLVNQVDYSKTEFGWTLTVIVSQADGSKVTLTDCEGLSRPLSQKVDELDLIKEHYFLEVCSPGVSEDLPGYPSLG